MVLRAADPELGGTTGGPLDPERDDQCLPSLASILLTTVAILGASMLALFMSKVARIASPESTCPIHDGPEIQSGCGMDQLVKSIANRLGLLAVVFSLGITGCSGAADLPGTPMGGGGTGGGSLGSTGGSAAETGDSGRNADAGDGATVSDADGSGGGAVEGGAVEAGVGVGGGDAGGRAPHRFSIRFDYRYDTVGFFTVPARRAALEAAGAIWSGLIHDDFATVPAGTRIRTRNPENRDEYLWVEGIEQDIDDLLVFVGTSEAIPGLGRGGASNGVESTDAVLSAALAARTVGSDFEPWAGSISFKASSPFFFDTTPDTADDIPFGQYDFISNATHELGHVLGFSSSSAFDALISTTMFTGPAATTAYGGPVPLTADLGHFAMGTTSDGVKTLMDPGQPNGARFTPTRLDLAVFKDIGYQLGN